MRNYKVLYIPDFLSEITHYIRRSIYYRLLKRHYKALYIEDFSSDKTSYKAFYIQEPHNSIFKTCTMPYLAAHKALYGSSTYNTNEPPISGLFCRKR